MEEHRTPQEELYEEKEREEYSFLQEVIKDETDSAKKIKDSVFRTIGYGVLLGIAASVVFCAFNPWLEKHFNNNPVQVEIPKDEEEEDSGNEPAEEEKKVVDGDGYRQVLQTLNSIATEAKKSMVTVECLADIVGQDSNTKKCESGIIIADNGRELLIFANILDAKTGESIQITFSDGKSYKAVQKMKDHNLGFCIYAVMREDIDKETWSAIDTMVIGSSNSVENGDAVIVLGRPFGTDEATGYGVVTADEEYVERADGHYRLICTNIAGAGDGSGAILNRYGQLVGVIDQSVLGEGSNGRVGGYGISDIKKVIELMSNGSDIPYTGIYGMDVTDELSEKGMPKGVYVKEVVADSPAMAAGIQSGDVIIAVDGEDIVDLSNYHSILMRKSKGGTIKLHGCRQGAGDEYVDIDFKVTVSSTSKD